MNQGANKKLSPVVTQMFLRGRKLNISFVFLSQSCFSTTHYFIVKVSNKRELQQVASNHLSYIEFKDFMKLYKYTEEPFLFSVNSTPLPSDNSVRFNKNLLQNDCW